MKQVAVLGSCVTRDNFNRLFNEDYKTRYNCRLNAHQASVISLVSAPVTQSAALTVFKDKEKMTPLSYRSLHNEVFKDVMQQLKTTKVDYVLLDFYSDVYEGVVAFNDGTYLTNNIKFRHLFQQHGLYKDTKVLNSRSSFRKYFRLWKAKADILIERLLKYFRPEQIILTQFRFSDTFTDGTSLNAQKIKRGVPTLNIKTINQHLDKMNRYFVRHSKCRVIDTGHFKLDKNHRWGEFYLHFVPQYYHHYLNQLDNMIKNDELTTQSVPSQRSVKKTAQGPPRKSWHSKFFNK